MRAEPAISVIIPAYNSESYVAEAIESVLRQTFSSHEIIVIDDGSTDETAVVVARYPEVRYFFQENSGIGAARNHGVQEARGRCFAFLDSDDIWTEGKLAAQVAAIQADPGVDVLYGHVRQFQSPDTSVALQRRARFVGDALPGYLPGTMMVTSDAFFRVGWFGTTWDVGEAVDWHLRAAEQDLRIVMLPDVFLLRRLHQFNQGIQRRDARTDYVRILKASLDRRRASQEPGDAPSDMRGEESTR
jgi:glycosyltransferase involved in cell wall biosynthesis